VRAVTHDFIERLEWSGALSDESAWVSMYRRLWPDMISAVRVDADSAYQRRGIDRIVLLNNGRQLWIDEKKRARDYGDFLCEVGSARSWDKSGPGAGHRIGWTLDPSKECDFIAYAVMPNSVCHLIPFELLRQAAVEFVEKWKAADLRYPRLARSSSWVTANVAVPWDVLWRDMRAVSRRHFVNRLELPKPVQDGEQLTFYYK